MDLGKEIGSYGRTASQMPLPIVQGAQYMNDAASAVLGKLTLRNYKKSTEFRGGIWDCSPVKVTPISRPPCGDISNSKILSLDEILACDDEENTSLPNKDVFSIFESTPADVSSTEMIVDTNNKRWRSEEFDKTHLLPSNGEVTRKKYKKNVSFSADVIDLEASSKIKSIADKLVEPDVIVIEDEVNNFNETPNESNRKKKLVLSSGDVNDDPVKMDEGTVPEKKSAVKKSAKVKNWIQLVSQSSKNQLPNQQHNNEKKLEFKLEEKLVSKEGCRSLKMKRNDYIVKHDTHEVNNEELKNLSHLETVMPEILDFTESDCEIDLKATNKILNDNLSKGVEARKLSNTPNLVQQLKKSSKKKSPSKDISPPVEIDLTNENEMESNSVETVDSEIKKQKENEEHLRSLLLEFFNNDEKLAESIKTKVVKLAEQKNKIDVKREKYERDNFLGEQQLKNKPIVEHDASFVDKPKNEQFSHVKKLEDESQCYNSYALHKERVCNQPFIAKQTFNHLNSERKDEVKVIAEKTLDVSGKVSPTLHRGVHVFYNSVSKSDYVVNWRTQCIDVRQKDLIENTALSNWRNEQINSASKTSDGKERKSDRKERYRQEIFTYQVDKSFKSDYLYDEPVKVVPLNLSEPPDPSTRFKDIKADPQSIWEAVDEKNMPPPNPLVKKSSTDLKNESKSEEIHAQKGKTTSIPRFYDIPSPIIEENVKDKVSSSDRSRSLSPVKLNESYGSRSGQNFQRKSFERNRSSSHRRSPVTATSYERDIFFVIKIKSLEDSVVKKFKIHEAFFDMKNDNSKISEVIPNPGSCPREIGYSVSTVNIFVRCLFSLSYQIPNWLTALEAFSLAKKYRVKDLIRGIQDYFINLKIQADEIYQIAASAKQLEVLEALKYSKFFQAVQSVTSFTGQKVCTSGRCVVQCSVLAPKTELVVPLHLEIHKSLESCNEADVKNSIFFTAVTGTSLTGIELKFLTEDVDPSTDLHIVCEVFQSKQKLFFEELDSIPKSTIKISFEKEIELKGKEQVEISVFIDSVLLKMFPRLIDCELVDGNFHAQLKSSKTIEKNKLFCIHKIFYTS